MAPIQTVLIVLDIQLKKSSEIMMLIYNQPTRDVFVSNDLMKHSQWRGDNQNITNLTNVIPLFVASREDLLVIAKIDTGLRVCFKSL